MSTGNGSQFLHLKLMLQIINESEKLLKFQPFLTPDVEQRFYTLHRRLNKISTRRNLGRSQLKP